MREYSILNVLRTRDGMTDQQAREALREMRDDVRNGADPEELLHEIGLEPDYIFDLL